MVRDDVRVFDLSNGRVELPWTEGEDWMIEVRSGIFFSDIVMFETLLLVTKEEQQIYMKCLLRRFRGTGKFCSKELPSVLFHLEVPIVFFL